MKTEKKEKKRKGKDFKNVCLDMNKTEAVLLYLFTVVSKQVNTNITLVHVKQSTQKMYKDYSKLFPCQFFIIPNPNKS